MYHLTQVVSNVTGSQRLVGWAEGVSPGLRERQFPGAHAAVKREAPHGLLQGGNFWASAGVLGGEPPQCQPLMSADR